MHHFGGSVFASELDVNQGGKSCFVCDATNADLKIIFDPSYFQHSRGSIQDAVYTHKSTTVRPANITESHPQFTLLNVQCQI